MLQVIWFFFIYAFIGWCAEVTYAAVVTGKFVNRGFLNGPWCPIYGIGVLVVVALLDPLKDNLALMFVGSVLVTSLIEGVGGFVLEKLFRQRWWDYSDRPLNIGGYVCLQFSLMWGVGCLLVVDRIHPLISSFTLWMPLPLSVLLLILLTCTLVTDLTATVVGIAKFNRNLDMLTDLSRRIREASDSLGENLATGTLVVMGGGELLQDFVGEKVEESKEKLESKLEGAKDRLENKLDEAKDRFENTLDAAKEHFEGKFDSVSDVLEEKLEATNRLIAELRERSSRLMESTSKAQRRMLGAFPAMKSIQNREALENVRNAMRRISRKRQ